MKYSLYVFETVLYGIVGVLGILGVVYFILQERWFLSILGVVLTYVAFDNFFCSSRAKKAGVRTKKGKHYIFPFVKK